MFTRFFFNDTATTEIYTLSLHDALPISTSFHLIGYSSNLIKRVCRATVQAEAYTLQAGVEEGDRIRAAIVDTMNKLDRKRWEATSAASIPQIWFTDCKSVHDTLVRRCPS